MNDSFEGASLALLPIGLRDVLPPDAAFETEVGRRLLDRRGQRQLRCFEPAACRRCHAASRRRAGACPDRSRSAPRRA